MTLAVELKEMFGILNSKMTEEENTAETSENKTENGTKEEIDEATEEIPDIKPSGNSNENHKEITKNFNRFVEFHAEVKQLSKNITKLNYFLQKNYFSLFRLSRDSSNTFESMTLVFFVWSILAICGSLLLIQMETVKYFVGNLFYHINNTSTS